MKNKFEMFAAFACFCEDHAVCPKKMAEFCHLIDKRKRHLARWSIKTRQEDFEKEEIVDHKIIRQIQDVASQMGWMVEFHAVIPTIIDKNSNVIYPPFL